MFENVPPFPSEVYLQEVLARKKPRGPYLTLVRPRLGQPGVEWSANLLKAARKAMAMAWLEARKLEAIPPRNNGLRRLAAAVLAGFMESKPEHYGNPQRIVHSHTDYAHALAYYRYHIYSKRNQWQPIPGAPVKPTAPADE